MKASSKHSSTPSSGDPGLFEPLEKLFDESLKRGLFSGASVLMASHEDILFQRTWGHTRSGGAPIDSNTLFDLASLTKPLITAALTLSVLSRGILDCDDPLTRFFPAGSLPGDKKTITLRQLLNHCSGLPDYRAYYPELIRVSEAQRSSALLSRILRECLVAPPGSVCLYSDLGFLLLGEILADTLGKPLDQLASEWILRPLGIEGLGFRRLKISSDPGERPEMSSEDTAPFAVTEYCRWRGRLLEGEVHDENAYCLQGVAGHAGLFGTARGVFSLLAFLWSVYRGTTHDSSWSCDLLRDFWTRQDLVPESTWALGFDTPSCGISSAGGLFSSRSVGHLGFTGTSFWLDIEQNVLVVLLTNRVYPTRENSGIKEFRPLVHNLLMEAFYELSRR